MTHVAVVLPAWNAERFLADAMGSVLHQSHADLELVVVDDGSTDTTLAVARSFTDPRVTVLTGANAGQQRARNRGADASTGEVLAFLDADDRWHPNKLERQLAELEDRDVVAVGSLLRFRGPDGRELGVRGQPIGPEELELVREGRLLPVALSSLVVRRSVFDEVGGFDESIPHAEDVDLIARLCHIGRFVVVPEVLGHYGVHAASQSALDHDTQRALARFVPARLAARAAGGDLSWPDFLATYRPSWAQRIDDRSAGLYRRAGLHAAEGRAVRSVATAALAGLLRPRYVLTKLRQQRPRLPWR